MKCLCLQLNLNFVLLLLFVATFSISVQESEASNYSQLHHTHCPFYKYLTPCTFLECSGMHLETIAKYHRLREVHWLAALETSWWSVGRLASFLKAAAGRSALFASLLGWDSVTPGLCVVFRLCVSLYPDFPIVRTLAILNFGVQFLIDQTSQS